jgi:hypothetical protein
MSEKEMLDRLSALFFSVKQNKPYDNGFGTQIIGWILVGIVTMDPYEVKIGTNVELFADAFARIEISVLGLEDGYKRYNPASKVADMRDEQYNQIASNKSRP